MGVVSNATGKMREQLARLDLAKHFDFIFDSAVVGIEKPSPAIFTMAAHAAGGKASEALFVGDSYSIDVAGAAYAGIGGVLMDASGAYAHRSSRNLVSPDHFPRRTQSDSRKFGWPRRRRTPGRP